LSPLYYDSLLHFEHLQPRLCPLLAAPFLVTPISRRAFFHPKDSCLTTPLLWPEVHLFNLAPYCLRTPCPVNLNRGRSLLSSEFSVSSSSPSQQRHKAAQAHHNAVTTTTALPQPPPRHIRFSSNRHLSCTCLITVPLIRVSNRQEPKLPSPGPALSLSRRTPERHPLSTQFLENREFQPSHHPSPGCALPPRR
jgi:hypothetical protein